MAPETNPVLDFIRSEGHASSSHNGPAQLPAGDRPAQTAGGQEFGQKGGVGVADAAASGILTLGEFFTNFFDPAPAQPQNRVQQIIAERERDKAIGRMSENLAREEPVHSADIKALNAEDIVQLRQQGDPYLHQLVAEHDRKRHRYLGRDREREQ